MYCRPEEATPSQPVAAEATDDERFLIQLREWSVRMWREEVEHRPLVNIHRARLDATWRTVMQRAGLVPNEVVGPAALAAPVEVQASPWLDGDVAKKIADENFVSYEVVQIIARALAGRPAPAAELEPVAMYRGACVDGSRCLHGCHSNEPCYYTRQAAPLSEVDTPHIPIRDLLRIYEACNGDWCSIAREVERRTIDALRPTPSNEQG